MLGNYVTISPPKANYEVADVFRLFLEDYRQQYSLTYRQEEVIRAILACRTPEMGGVVNRCEECGAVQFVFRSCGDRHCPKCGKYRTLLHFFLGGAREQQIKSVVNKKDNTTRLYVN